MRLFCGGKIKIQGGENKLIKYMNRDELTETERNEEELSIYDILVKPELSKDDIVKVKSVSIELLQKIKEIIAGSDHWSEKLETRASVDIVIRDTLWDELPECYDDSNIDDCRDRISRYIYERFGRAA